ncbi:FAD-binding oxidoreductase [Pseudomonas indica]|uniref:FAD/FMN-containing dehydrogenase n=1 Tax=Pseudomonas indica TaxID=137658 RepID=A0A1G9MA48_9PSED|nr:FAD-binding oxidoreductase [Pseudomonas indica]MBU3057271.1 FAD-binding oxidoreductase [Pseudomonas indica]SDL70807.1 FAD/FMN-containing dehydrogenase [Pseudomonas indica]
MLIQGWGRYPSVNAVVEEPRTISDTIAVLTNSGPLIGRGMGRSYGDSASSKQVISTRALNHLKSFDQETGLLHCSAGITLGELLELFTPRGWFLPVTPGTKFVTLGGAIASDVHGKNHHLIGCFSEIVDSFRLLLASGEALECSREQNADLFFATCGGMGLTGLILDVCLRLKPITSAYIEQTTHKATNLVEVMDLFDSEQGATYSVAWIDCLAGDKNLGRSLLMTGEHSTEGGLELPRNRPINVPIDLPSALLNRYSVQAFNTLYYNRVRTLHNCERVTYESFFYPLDRILNWNRLYGKNGFVQYQFVIPKDAGRRGMHDILKRIASSHRGSFLAVLKAFGRENPNLLSFPMEGYTLALDFKISTGLFELLNELDAMVLDHGGRIYLAKDARMSEATFKRSYNRWEDFQTVRSQYGAINKFTSLQSHRLGLE